MVAVLLTEELAERDRVEVNDAEGLREKFTVSEAVWEEEREAVVDSEVVGENVLLQVWEREEDVVALLESVRESEADPVGETERLPVRLGDGLTVQEKLEERLPVRLAVEVVVGEREDVLLLEHETELVKVAVPVRLLVTLPVLEALREGLMVKLREELALRVVEPDVLRLTD